MPSYIHRTALSDTSQRLLFLSAASRAISLVAIIISPVIAAQPSALSLTTLTRSPRCMHVSRPPAPSHSTSSLFDRPAQIYLVGFIHRTGVPAAVPPILYIFLPGILDAADRPSYILQPFFMRLPSQQSRRFAVLFLGFPANLCICSYLWAPSSRSAPSLPLLYPDHAYLLHVVVPRRSKTVISTHAERDETLKTNKQSVDALSASRLRFLQAIQYRSTPLFIMTDIYSAPRLRTTP